MGKAIAGLLLIILGAALGVFLGVWVMFVGGIVQGIEGVKANPVDAIDIALGVLRVVGAGFVGWTSALLLIFPGVALINDA